MGHPIAKDLCLKILQEAMDFLNSYVPMLTTFYQKLIAKVCEGGKCSVALQQAYWEVATRAFKVMLDEVYKVWVEATSAQITGGGRGMGLFLHATL